jgi:hypothetical protein
MPGTFAAIGGRPHARTAPDFLDSLRRRRRSVVQGFLWVLLAVIGLTLVLNVALLGRAGLGAQALAPNLLFACVVVAALWFNRRDRFRVALGLVIGLTLLSATAPVWLAGLSGNAVALFLFFVPVVMAGMLLERAWLYATCGWSLAAVLGAAAVQGAGRTRSCATAPSSG